MSEMNEAGARDRRMNWLVLAFGLTVVYLLALCFLILPATAMCSPVPPGANFIGTFISCRTTNEVGDFLAGAFAPVAFIWLVAAVLIQAQELKAQRAELALTRQEFVASRKVMEEQAAQAKNQALQAQRQADFIGEQTENLKRQAEDYYRDKQDRIFDETLKAVFTDAVAPLSSRRTSVVTPNGQMIGSFGDYRAMNAENALRQLSGSLSQLRTALSGEVTGKVEVPFQIIEILPGALKPLIDMYDGLSPAYKVKFTSLRLAESSREAEAIVSAKRN